MDGHVKSMDEGLVVDGRTFDGQIATEDEKILTFGDGYSYSSPSTEKDSRSPSRSGGGKIELKLLVYLYLG